ncbi:proteasome subunit domain-containing protein [Ditylenchus destructor]|uniref:proteasome endopeptidase complex n=1 Tax=Ditylenchus destructor TaxID=166010 RepID=A0AAD4MSG2_9BILA|nr:proteasome subunit domain-containing protein [Ditylenchus destructor]
MEQSNISCGTTLIACEYDEGIVVGTDSRTSAGSFIATRVTDKITPVTNHIVCCRSGSAADTQAINDLVRYYVEAHSMMEGEALSVYRATQIFRSFLYDYRDQLSASVLVAGWDKAEKGQLYAIPLGGYVKREKFTASGSGSTFVMGFLDKQWKPNLNLEGAKELVRTAVGLAVNRDGSSGGVIRLAWVNEKGTHRELIRPDGGSFPTFAEPAPYPSFPKHITQNYIEEPPSSSPMVAAETEFA